MISKTDEIKILIIDDSVFSRGLLKNIIEQHHPNCRVASSSDGIKGLEKIRTFQPNLITLDIEMPNMNGLDVLLELRKHDTKIPVIVVSSLTSEGAKTTLEALSRGADGFICKPDTTSGQSLRSFEDGLKSKIKALIQSRAKQACPEKKASLPKSEISLPSLFIPETIKSKLTSRHNTEQTIIIGSSTGGPKALERLLPELNPDWPARYIIVQHMPQTYTLSLAERLNSRSNLHVTELSQCQELKQGRVIIARGGEHLVFRSKSKLCTDNSAPVENVRPSVDITIQSALKTLDTNEIIYIILTGLGKDGLEGAVSLKAKNGLCITQDEASSVIYGMPRVINEAGLSDYSISLEALPLLLSNMFDYLKNNKEA